MSHKTVIKIYEIASYVLILGATVVFFMMKESPMRLSLTMILVKKILGVFLRRRDMELIRESSTFS